jgi:hypothetical protein
MSLERPSHLASRTTMLLQGATNYFDRTQLRIHTAGRSPRPSMGSRDRPRLGVAPWHRRHSQDSMLSVSSSVRKLLMGKTPIATPRHEKHYVGPEGKSYPTGTVLKQEQLLKNIIMTISVSVQLASSDPDEPTFLPSVSCHYAPTHAREKAFETAMILGTKWRQTKGRQPEFELMLNIRVCGWRMRRRVLGVVLSFANIEMPTSTHRS